MKPSIGEFLGEKTASFATAYEVPVQLMVEGFLGFLDREVDGVVEAQLASHKSQPDKRVLRQFENTLLRYEEPSYWCNFLEGLNKPGKSGGLLQKFLEWLKSKETGPVNRCLEEAAGILRDLYYGETARGVKHNYFPPIEEDDWQPLVAGLQQQLRPVVMRDLLLRTVRGVLYEP
jgi:hypothetical protein